MDMLRRLFQWCAHALYALSSIGLKKEHCFHRYRMYKRLEAIGQEFPIKSGSVLSISHSLHLAPILGVEPTGVTHANYPEVNILSLPYADNSFDYVLSDQVFEHIEGNPQTAIDECLRVLKPGGIMVHTTCFLTPNHGPGDYWRYTPEGLSLLCKSASKVINAEGAGSPLYPLMTFCGFIWTPVVIARWHPMNWVAMYRRASYDYTVWVVAQK
jgi:SAM-dependent methyltransferase